MLIGRLIVANQTFVPSELLALLLLMPLVVLMHRLTPQPRRAAFVVIVAIVFVVESLGPFAFTAAGAYFDLWPFVTWFNVGLANALRATDWAQVFGHVFMSAALMWVLRKWGASIALAIGLTTGLALLIEILQVWLPHHDATIIDPLLTLAIGLAMRALYRRDRPLSLARR